jgi:IMP dehydrogenase/GMP reductase
MTENIHKHRILILDFGSQYTQLVARRVRELGVYCELWAWKEIIHQQMGGLRSCMGLTGCGTIDLLRTKAEFVRISGAGIQESHVHDVTITKESPNYRMGS